MDQSRNTIDKPVGVIRGLADSRLRDRSITEVVKDIIGNVQDNVRGEMRLATTQAKDAAVNKLASGRVLVVGAGVSVLAAAYLLLALVYALETVMPNWAAAASVGLVLATIAGVTVSAGLGRWKRNE